MFTILLSFIVGAAAGISLVASETAGRWGAIAWGVVVTLVVYALAAWIVRKRMMRVMNRIQSIAQDGQRQLAREMGFLQSRPTGNPKQAMQKMEAMQRDLIQESLRATEELEPFKPWVPLLGRQIATMRMHFHYQLKEFKKVDELLPKCILLEPMTVAVSMARMHSRKEDLEDIRKIFNKGVARLKYNQSVLVYSLMAWILLQNREEEEAHKVLLEASKNNENATLKRNLDYVANNRSRQFSNAGLGDEWYSLHLETPRMTMRRVMPRADGRPF